MSILWLTVAVSVEIILSVFVFLSKPKNCLQRFSKNNPYNFVHLQRMTKFQNCSNLIGDPECGRSLDSTKFSSCNHLRNSALCVFELDTKHIKKRMYKYIYTYIYIYIYRVSQ